MKKQPVVLYSIISAGVILALVFVASLAFAGGLALAPQLTQVASADTTVQTQTDSSLTTAQLVAGDDVLAAFENALTGMYEKTVPSVVRLDVVQRVNLSSGNRFFFPGHPPIPNDPNAPDLPGDLLPQGQGSGFIWDTEGHIVTNNHVVENAERVEVIFYDGTRLPGEVLSTDPDSDLAVVKVDLPAGMTVTPLPLGDSDALKPGQLAIALGAPFGQDFTMTTGIVSAVGRTIRSGNTPFSIPAAIQTDAPINPGNSGGPLLDRQGAVIGINTQMLSRTGSSAGVGFSVPINIAKRVVPTLIQGQAYDYAWLGISGTDLSPQVADLMNLPTGTHGAIVMSVAEGGPAAKAGLLGSDLTDTVDGQNILYGGDVIVAIDGNPVNGIDDVITYLVEQVNPGDQIKVDIMRTNGASETLNVTLGSRPTN